MTVSTRRTLSRIRPPRAAARTPQAIGAEMANQINRSIHMKKERAALARRLAQMDEDILKTDRLIATLNERLLRADPALARQVTPRLAAAATPPKAKG